MKLRIVFVGLLLSILSLGGGLEAQAMNKKQQNIVAIAALTGKGDLVKLKSALIKGLDDGLTVNEMKEVLVHTFADRKSVV